MASAASRVACEALERRQLLTVFTYTVPAGNTAVYLKEGTQEGWVDVHLNSVDGTIGHTFKGNAELGTGMYVIDAGSNGSAQNPFLFVDQVAAAGKPTADAQGDNGLKVLGGIGGSTLRIEATPTDTRIRSPIRTRAIRPSRTSTSSTSPSPAPAPAQA